ncbi:MAG TPA: hypothetical protein VGG39_22125 [Polyangiaceae bacterium]|jgi:hypothetical protein
MAQTAFPRGRRALGVLAFAVPLLAAVVGFAVACAETRAPIGDPCLKSEDCLSGICAQLVCASAPPTTSVELTGEGGEGDAEATQDTGTADTATPVPDSAPGPEAAAETSSSGGGEAGPEAAGD